MTRLPRMGLVGATGLAGCEFLSITEHSGLKGPAPRLYASESSADANLPFRGERLPVGVLAPDCFDGLEVVVFATSAAISREWAPRAVQAGAWVVDKSSAFRLERAIPLIVPEVNPDVLPSDGRPCIIANPNCSTIQLVVVLEPLRSVWGLSSVVVSTYQSVSGAGKLGPAQLDDEIAGMPTLYPAFPVPILGNAIPQIGPMDAQGYCEEESKLIAETRKILRLPRLAITATTVRIPSFNAHGEAVLVSLCKSATVAEINALLAESPGVTCYSDPADWPHPLQVSGTDPVAVGRVRAAFAGGKSFWLWIVGDNLRKGAALNAWQTIQLLEVKSKK